VSEILWQGAAHLLLATDAAHELAVVETLPAQGVALSLLAPLPLAVEDAPAQAASVWPATALAVDPDIAALLAQVTPAEKSRAWSTRSADRRPPQSAARR
jgi:hypothetical protein